MEVLHSGVIGQKWGQRRWQNEDGSYTEEGKARRRISGRKTYGELSKKERKALKKERKEKEREENFEDRKKKAINDADYEFAIKNAEKFSNEELDQLANRYRKLQQVYKIQEDELKKSSEKLHSWSDKLKKSVHSLAEYADDFSKFSKAQADHEKEEILRLQKEKLEEEKKDRAEAKKEEKRLKDLKEKEEKEKKEREERAALNEENIRWREAQYKREASKREEKYQKEKEKRDKEIERLRERARNYTPSYSYNSSSQSQNSYWDFDSMFEGKKKKRKR